MKIIVPSTNVIDVTKEQDEIIMILQKWLTDSNGYPTTPPPPIG